MASNRCFVINTPLNYQIRCRVKCSINQSSIYFYDSAGHIEEYNGQKYLIMTIRDKKMSQVIDKIKS